MNPKLIAVRLDNPHFGAGPATVVAHPANVAEYRALITDRDGAYDERMRLWMTLDDVPIGTRVMASLLPDTGLAQLTGVKS